MYKSKLNTIILFTIAVILITIIFIDSDTLNTLCINYETDFLVKEVNTTTEKKEEPIKQEIQKQEEPPEQQSSPVATLVSAPVNKWVWPTTNNYSITGYYSRYHNAIDIAGSNGSNIFAANSGVVTSVKGGCVVGNLSCNGRGGNYVVIKHNTNNYYTVYMHLKNIYVSIGQTVSSGQVIGTMGNTGNVIPVPTSSNPYAGTHLHFSLYIGEPYKGGYTINPFDLY